MVSHNIGTGYEANSLGHCVATIYKKHDQSSSWHDWLSIIRLGISLNWTYTLSIYHHDNEFGGKQPLPPLLYPHKAPAITYYITPLITHTSTHTLKQYIRGNKGCTLFPLFPLFPISHPLWVSIATTL